MKGKEIIFSITALVILLTACLAQSSETAPELISEERTQLIDDIYKYSFIFKVGDGDFDKIGVYRVVKEKQSVPIKAKNAVMMVHGDTSDFDSEFLMSTMSVQSISVP